MAPTVVFAHERGGARFTCVYAYEYRDIQWLVNGTSQYIQHPTNVETTQSSLTFLKVPAEYNGTTVQCTALSHLGTIGVSNAARLLIQGKICMCISAV